MKANELRIGNYIDYEGIIDKVSSISLKIISLVQYSSLDFEEINSIPLTEEWLLKFGFEKCTCNGWVCNFPERLHLEYNLSFKHHKPIEYVHQLQNLYFALTNEELKIS